VFEFVQDLFLDSTSTASSTDFAIETPFGSFEGPPFFISGEGNLIDGQLFLGNLVGSGMEFMAGSAYIRSVGYAGFENAISGVQGEGSGFMFWSGSVLRPQAPGEYGNTLGEGGGVGIEMVATSESYFRWRSGWPAPEGYDASASLLDIRADSFYVGTARDKPGGQFISGSGGNIEISSSNFHLSDGGDVTMQGTITADAGYIGAWVINDTGLMS
jgi:hypothetical protein